MSPMLDLEQTVMLGNKIIVQTEALEHGGTQRLASHGRGPSRLPG